MFNKYKDIIFVIIIILMVLFGWSKGVFKNNTSNDDKIKRDTIYRTEIIQGKSGQFNNDRPIHIYVQTDSKKDDYLNGIVSELSTIKTENAKTQKLLQELALRVYEKTYEDKDVTIKVTDSINGRLRNQNVTWKIKPQKIQVKEVITTIEKKPKFVFSLGAGVSSQLNTTAAPQLNVIAGFKNRKGNELQFSYSTDKTATFTYKKDIFKKY